MGTILAPHQAHYRPEPLPVQAAYGGGLRESLVRVLMALYRGEHQVAKIVQVPTAEEEDDKRHCCEAAAIFCAIESGIPTAFGGCSTCTASGTSIPTG